MLGVQGGDEIVLVPVGEGDEGVGGGEILRLQQLLVGAVSADDGGVGELLAEQAAAVHPLLHELHRQIHLDQQRGEVLGDAPAADEEDRPDLGDVPAQQPEELAQPHRLTDDVQGISRQRDEAAVGDVDLIAPLGGAEQDREVFQLAGLLGQGAAAQEIPLLEQEAHHLHPPPVKRLDGGGVGEAEQPGDLGRGGQLRVDDHVDAQVLFQRLQVGGVVQIADPRDGVVGAQPLGGEAADHVHLVLAGGGDDHVCRLHPGLLQRADGGTVAVDAHDVQRLRGVGQSLLVGVDDGDVVVLPGELFRQGVAHLAVADDDDLHGDPSFLCGQNLMPATKALSL